MSTAAFDTTSVTGSEKRLRTARLSPDRFGVAVLAMVLVTVILASSYVFSFAAIAEAAAWTGAPAWTYPLAPVFIDGAILTYTLTYAVFRHRNEPARRTLLFLYLFTSISTVINVAHALTTNDFDFGRPYTWFGALIASSAPLGALLSSEEVIRLALVPPKAANEAERVPVVVAHGLTQEFTSTAPDNADAPFDPDYDIAPEEHDEGAPSDAEWLESQRPHWTEEKVA